MIIIIIEHLITTLPNFGCCPWSQPAVSTSKISFGVCHPLLRLASVLAWPNWVVVWPIYPQIQDSRSALAPPQDPFPWQSRDLEWVSQPWLVATLVAWLGSNLSLIAQSMEHFRNISTILDSGCFETVLIAAPCCWPFFPWRVVVVRCCGCGFFCCWWWFRSSFVRVWIILSPKGKSTYWFIEMHLLGIESS